MGSVCLQPQLPRALQRLLRTSKGVSRLNCEQYRITSTFSANCTTPSYMIQLHAKHALRVSFGLSLGTTVDKTQSTRRSESSVYFPSSPQAIVHTEFLTRLLLEVIFLCITDPCCHGVQCTIHQIRGPLTHHTSNLIAKKKRLNAGQFEKLFSNCHIFGTPPMQSRTPQGVSLST